MKLKHSPFSKVIHRISTFIKNQELSNDYFKMNKVTKKSLLTGETFTPELHLKQPGFTYSACGPFIKHRERIQKIQKFRGTVSLKNLYRSELGKACFAHDAAYSDTKDFVKRIISDKILKDKAYEVTRWISKSISKYGL